MRRSRRTRRSRRYQRHEDLDDVAEAYRTMRRHRRPRRLYRDTNRGIFGGVCAGIAKYFGVEPWVIRLGYIAFAILGQVLIPIIIYIVLVMILRPENQPYDDWEYDPADSDADSDSPYSAIRTSPKLGMRVVAADVRELELRLRRLETYVTSPKYNLDKGFSDMGKT